MYFIAISYQLSVEISLENYWFWVWPH